jgi:predicted GIY-YIG superfamily endonuclease
MPTMYILRLKYVCIYTGPVTKTPLQKQWRIKSVEKDTYLKKYPALPVVVSDDIMVRTMKTLLSKAKAATNHFIPRFTLMNIC